MLKHQLSSRIYVVIKNKLKVNDVWIVTKSPPLPMCLIKKSLYSNRITGDAPAGILYPFNR